MAVIDAHCWLGPGIRASQTVDELLQSMDRAGIDRAVVSPSDQQVAVDNRLGNEAIAESVRRHPDRLIGFLTVNPWYLDGSLLELQRATELGLSGLYLHPALQGFLLLDRHADALIGEAVRLGLPIYVHTGTPIVGHPLQLAEVAIRHPSGKFIMGHAGHSDFWIDVIPAALSAPNLWVETSYKAPHVIREYVDALGPSRVIFGSDAPLNDSSLELAKLHGAALASEAFADVSYRNIASLIASPAETTS